MFIINANNEAETELGYSPGAAISSAMRGSCLRISDLQQWPRTPQSFLHSLEWSYKNVTAKRPLAVCCNETIMGPCRIS
jgi:hypothetical protein